ncbi:MAG: hypothetical protein IJW97_00810, partial [Clostridia bacterium]|nr:hypothetical protein [Clostridia bacterium]
MSSILSKQKEHLHRCSFYLRENPFLPNQQKKPLRAFFVGWSRQREIDRVRFRVFFLPKEK